jgi:hypothetical protein
MTPSCARWSSPQFGFDYFRKIFSALPTLPVLIHIREDSHHLFQEQTLGRDSQAYEPD